MLYLIRPQAEISLKSSQVRAKFLSLLARNIRIALKAQGVAAKISEHWDHLSVESDSPNVVSAVKQVFGIAIICPILRECESNLDDIMSVALEVFGPLVAGKTFGVRARTVRKNDISPSELAKNVGGLLFSGAAGVNLTNPDVWCHIHINNKRVYFFCERIPGAQGLPISSGGRALCLMSGGFDSPVAAWHMLKRGIQLDFLLCNLAGSEQVAEVQKVTKDLCDNWVFGYTPRFYVVDFQPLLENLKSSVRSKYWQVILKRLMYRAGEEIAKHVDAVCLVTGEALGQVSSQTIQNLRAIEDAVSIPVMRPLVAWDKEDIIRLSRIVGTHDASAGIQEHCSLAKKNLSTECGVVVAQQCHEALDVGLFEAAIAAVQEYPVGSKISTSNFYIDHVPEGCLVIDVRPKNIFQNWHYPEAVNVEFEHLLAIAPKLPKEKTYVLYCSISIQSLVAAEILQRHGLEAFCFKGGTTQLKKIADNECDVSIIPEASPFELSTQPL